MKPLARVAGVMVKCNDMHGENSRTTRHATSETKGFCLMITCKVGDSATSLDRDFVRVSRCEMGKYLSWLGGRM